MLHLVVNDVTKRHTTSATQFLSLGKWQQTTGTTGCMRNRLFNVTQQMVGETLTFFNSATTIKSVLDRWMIMKHQVILSTTNPTWTNLGSNPGFHGERLLSYHLCQGTVLNTEKAFIACYLPINLVTYFSIKKIIIIIQCFEFVLYYINSVTQECLCLIVISLVQYSIYNLRITKWQDMA